MAALAIKLGAAAGSWSDAVERVGVEADAIADLQAGDFAALEGARRAVVETNADPVARDALVVVALDVVAGAGGAQTRHRDTADAAAELVADDRTEHPADDGAGAAALGPGADGLDAFHGA